MSLGRLLGSKNRPVTRRDFNFQLINAEDERKEIELIPPTSAKSEFNHLAGGIANLVLSVLDSQLLGDYSISWPDQEISASL